MTEDQNVRINAVDLAIRNRGPMPLGNDELIASAQKIYEFLVAAGGPAPAGAGDTADE